MSQINRLISNESVIPQVETPLFDDYPDSRFAVGALAVGDVPLDGMKGVYDAYFDLRRKVYVDQTGQLSAEDIGLDGTDRDEDDPRSIAFGVVENRGSEQRLVAGARLIVKGLDSTRDQATDRPLPVEEDWPEVFGSNPAPKDAFEISRLISRHEKAAIQQINKIKLYTDMLAYVEHNNLGPAYAIVEDWFERDLRRLVPVQRIGEPKYVEKYLDNNVALEVDIPGLSRRMGGESERTATTKLGEMAYYGVLKSLVSTDSA